MLVSRTANQWFSSFGRLSLSSDGSSITGRYDHKSGEIEGIQEGSSVRGTWREADGKGGPFEWSFDPGNNTFRGNWKFDGEDGWHGVWNGVCLDRPEAGEDRWLGSWNSQTEGPLLAGPMLGEVSSDQAIVWIQARDESPCTLVLTSANGVERRVEVTPTRSSWLCAAVVIPGLNDATRYTYRVESVHGKSETGAFQTAPALDSRKTRLAFGSCYDAHEAPLPIFDAIGREGVDAFVLMGDNCYFSEPDWQSQHTMMLAQLRNRNNPSFTALARSLPILAIWDDHDFGPNDSDSTFAGRFLSIEAFKRVWAQRRYGEDDLVGIFSVVRWGPVEMFLTDGRWERITENRILGDRQLTWLQERLSTSDAPIKIIVSGSQVLPLAAVEKDWECWRKDAPEELDRLLAFIAEKDIQGVLYVSGDVHLGYILHQIGRPLGDGMAGPETWELTTSPLSNDPWWETVLSPGQPYDPFIVREVRDHNYGVIDVDLDRAGHEVHLLLKDPQGRTLVDQPLGAELLKRGKVGRTRPTPLVDTSPAAVSRPRLTAALLRGRTIQFVCGDIFVTIDVDKRSEPSPKIGSIRTAYPETTPNRTMDTAFIWPSRDKAYFFQGLQYWRFDLATRKLDGGYPGSIAEQWPGLFENRIDAVLVTDDKAFFFRRSEYTRYDLAADKADADYPRPIAGNWPGVWPDGVDAAVGPIDGKAYLFKGPDCIRYDMASDSVDAGYPRPIREEWPALEVLFPKG